MADLFFDEELVQAPKLPAIRFTFCRHYLGVANGMACSVGQFAVREHESTVEALQRAKQAGCVLEYFTHPLRPVACPRCPHRAYPLAPKGLRV